MCSWFWLGLRTSGSRLSGMRDVIHLWVPCNVRPLLKLLSTETHYEITCSWTYASNLAYIADANLGRSSSAFATNSAARGLSAFIATEIAVPLQVCKPLVPVDNDFIYLT
jgi:hypothetical protein